MSKTNHRGGGEVCLFGSKKGKDPQTLVHDKKLQYIEMFNLECFCNVNKYPCERLSVKSGGIYTVQKGTFIDFCFYKKTPLQNDNDEKQKYDKIHFEEGNNKALHLIVVVFPLCTALLSSSQHPLGLCRYSVLKRKQYQSILYTLHDKCTASCWSL